MRTAAPLPVLTALRERVQRLEPGAARHRSVLPFGIEPIDRHLPDGGLALGALHEVAGVGHGAVDGAVAALFTAGIASRTRGQVLWCVTRQDLFAPAIAQAGLLPDRVIYVEADDEPSVLACCEEGLRHRGLGAVVAEVAGLSMTASRRLQLAAEGSGVIGIALRCWRRQADAAAFGQPTAAVTRWRVSPLPSTHCSCRASDAADGGLNWPVAVAPRVLFLKWRLAMRPDVLRFLRRRGPFRSSELSALGDVRMVRVDAGSGSHGAC
jgi:protein ImuA